MGICPSFCNCNKRRDYEPLNEKLEATVGADRSKLQAIADEDAEFLRDPTMKEILEGEDDAPLDDDELNKYIQDLDPQ
ncbi:hypothetical protein M9Y10_012829 [Tritrichomonas musculus]|uniref:Uncharacterized protein n=1 Tax=Tritrichomonas musculus TaxID=1915356 RepID=A0ABR2IDK5_9EUKA